MSILHEIANEYTDKSKISAKKLEKAAESSEPILEYNYGHKIGGGRKIYSVDGLKIGDVKHAYVCKKCRAVHASEHI